MSLSTPEKIDNLQRKRGEGGPAYRFHRLDILEHAYALAHYNDGAPGVDGVTSR